MALDLQEVLSSLSSKTNPEDNFFAKLAEDNEAAAEPVQEQDLEKIAELENLGREFGRAFAEDLEKVAVGKVGMTPETGAPMNPAVAMPANNADVNPEVLAQVMALINQAASGVGQTGSLVAGSVGGVGAATPQAPAAPDQYPIAADAIGTVGREKTAADRVVGTIWENYFGGEE